MKWWKQRARTLKQEISALVLALADRRTPWYARLLLVLVVAYALSPLDLIPDFIPLLGQLDDLLLLPLGIALVIRLIPAAVLVDCREKVAAGKPVPQRWRIAGLALVIGSWLIVAGLMIWWIGFVRTQ